MTSLIFLMHLLAIQLKNINTFLKFEGNDLIKQNLET